jgi:hypothetical protein
MKTICKYCGGRGAFETECYDGDMSCDQCSGEGTIETPVSGYILQTGDVWRWEFIVDGEVRDHDGFPLWPGDTLATMLKHIDKMSDSWFSGVWRSDVQFRVYIGDMLFAVRKPLPSLSLKDK